MNTKVWSRILLRLLFCALIGLASAGCYDEYATLTGLPTKSGYRERAAQKRTMDMLTTGYNTCLAAGKTDDICRRDLLAYRSCLDSGKNDAQCRAELFE